MNVENLRLKFAASMRKALANGFPEERSFVEVCRAVGGEDLSPAQWAAIAQDVADVWSCEIERGYLMAAKTKQGWIAAHRQAVLGLSDPEWAAHKMEMRCG